MDAKRIVEELTQEFPGKNILILPQDKPTEIICEIDPSSLHRESSVAIAYIDRSAPHYHRRAAETYVIEEGSLRLVVDGQEHQLQAGDTFVISPGQVHEATGDATRVRVESSGRGWTPKDHILIQIVERDRHFQPWPYFYEA